MARIIYEEGTSVLAENLPVLRAKLGVTQMELADLVGLSRQTIIALENKSRVMTKTTFLALLFIFSDHESTKDLLRYIELI